MIYKCIATGSKANCHLLIDTSGQILILDCGIKYRELCLHITDFSKIVGVCFSHKDADHFLGYADLMKNRITCVANETLAIGKTINLGNYVVTACPAFHRDTNCHSYFIRNTLDCKDIYFITDSTRCPTLKELPKNFAKAFSLILLEVNFDSETLKNCIDAETVEHRGYENHLCLGTAVDWLRDTIGVEYRHEVIVAHHLSQYHANPAIIKEVLSEYSDQTFIALRGLTIEF